MRVVGGAAPLEPGLGAGAPRAPCRAADAAPRPRARRRPHALSACRRRSATASGELGVLLRGAAGVRGNSRLLVVDARDGAVARGGSGAFGRVGELLRRLRVPCVQVVKWALCAGSAAL